MGKRMEYKWRLREIMASRGLNNISDILPLLNDRGIDLSSSQIYRLIGQKPERISLQLLFAVADALECTVEDLCAYETVDARTQLRKVGTDESTVASLKDSTRPRRARVYLADE